ncbi:NF-kappa-B essential modulator-like [Culex pipiens pallens]|uniref:NF-kappa-B essential modulator-like n=1 Tax=Culex pipiens pallens TaxID=42434 RepID=UPI001952E395|nr:NF-kappa-B essential modulator-like [Culex pipiens pallens]
MKMANQNQGDLREQVERLQEQNRLLEAKVAEHERLQQSCSNNLESMRTTLDALQDLLARCRADMVLQQQNQPTAAIGPEQQPRGKLQRANSTPAAMKSEIELLRAQLEVYKNDFAGERIARQVLQLEKNQLAGELQQLQQQNRTLIVEALNGSQAEQQDVRSFSRRSSRMSQISDAIGEDDQHADHLQEGSHCRHCDRAFGDIQSLETHIDECPAY